MSLDINNDGYITLAELKDALKDNDVESLRKLLDSVDTD